MISPLLFAAALALPHTTQQGVRHFADLGDTDRTWIGEDFFANRLQDWRIKGGRLECAAGAKKNPLRAAHLLTTTLSASEGGLNLSVRTGAIEAGALEAEAFSGFLFGGGGEHVDYRLSAMIHSKPGEDGGGLGVLGADGHVQMRDNSGSYSGGAWTVSGPLKKNAIPTLTEVSREIRRQVGVLVDRRGEVAHVMVGSNHGIELPDWGRVAEGLTKAKLVYFSGITLSRYSNNGLGRVLALRFEVETLRGRAEARAHEESAGASP